MINPVFCQRLRSARTMAGLSLQGLADRMGNQVTRQALHQYEQGGFMPDSRIIGVLCDALGIRPDDLFREHAVQLERLSFRKLRNFSAKNRRSLEEQAKVVIERYLELEQLLHLKTAFRIPARSHPIRSFQQVENFAELLRQQLQLGMGPIPNVLGLLEDHHIKVMEVDSSHEFAGCSAWDASGKIPVIILNSRALIHPEEKRLTALHELGHLLLNFRGLSEREQERYCHRFAAAMLLPAKTLVSETGTFRNNLYAQEVVEIKKQFGLSTRIIIERMRDLKIIRTSCFNKLSTSLKEKYKANTEPTAYQFPGNEQSHRFRQLLLRALAEEVISMSKAAALAGMRLAEFRQKFLSTDE
ncbi:MAG: helix-turn-helix domain-containing protein [Bacteroidota bacterium]